ncbi:uncharacterized protein J3D65DRAFT_656932, partial [Phyllosticta citribraziliensis]
MLFLLLALAVLVMASPACPRRKLACGATSTSKEALDSIHYVMELEKIVNKSSSQGTVDATNPFPLWNIFDPRPQIPVFIHVLDDYEDLFISQNMILDQFQILKTFYQPFGIDFHLQDVFFYDQPEWASGQDNWEMKAQLRLGGYDTLNIYLVEGIISNDGQLLGGFASNPSYLNLFRDHPWWYDEAFLPDGVELAVDALPYNVFGSNPLCQEGKVLVHEVGHWLGLLHIFHKGCDPDLESGGDYVFDTPPAADAMRQCFAPGTAIRTCQGPIFPDNLITNIMDDMPDSCRTDFTDGQVNRMFMTFHAMREGMPPANADLPPIRDETEVQTVAPNLPRIPPPEVSPFR